MGPICCPEMSVNSYHTMLLNIPEERRSQFIMLCGRRWNSLVISILDTSMVAFRV